MISFSQGDDTFVAFQTPWEWEFSVSGEIHFFPQDLYSPFIFLDLHPLPSQVFRFELAYSSLAIPSARSTIEQKYINNGLYLARKCARIFVRGHYLLIVVNSFPKV